jgi:hypothetical protein
MPSAVANAVPVNHNHVMRSAAVRMNTTLPIAQLQLDAFSLAKRHRENVSKLSQAVKAYLELERQRRCNRGLPIGKAVRTIAEVQRRVDWPGGRGCEAKFYQLETAWYLGLDLKNVPNAAKSAALVALTNPPEHWLVWIGYQGEDHERAQLALWIYCGDLNAQSNVARRLRRKLKHSLKDFHIDEPDRDKKYFSVIVTPRTHRQPSDVEWFCSVLKALGLTLKN